MKKLIMMLCLLIVFPLNVWAYASEVILGGNTIGIDIKTRGVMVIGFYKIEGKYPKFDIKEGDIITKVEDTEVNSIKELTQAIEENINDEMVVITYERNNKEKETTLKLEKSGGVYKTGLYVKDGLTGIGTLTFIDPKSKRYGALGHEIVEGNTSKVVEVRSGSIFRNSIKSIDESSDGDPGSKNAKFYYQTKYGDISKNTRYGIYGDYSVDYDDKRLIPVGMPEEVKIGDAKIYTVLENEDVKEYDIYITKINEHSDIKNLTFEITDEELLEKAGGIVQGMSGSPIVQDGKIIGAVTHVITDNVKSGYGLFITSMLEESEQ